MVSALVAPQLEIAYCCPIGRAEAEMCAGNRGSQFRLAGNGELNAKRSRRRTVIGAAAIAEIDYAHEPERT